MKDGAVKAEKQTRRTYMLNLASEVLFSGGNQDTSFLVGPIEFGNLVE